MIRIEDITYHYTGSRKNVFENFSLTLTENNIYGLLGKNGTGKSTLLYLISGLLHQQSGSIEVDGMESKKRNPEMLKEIFFVPEEFELPSISLARYVELYSKFYPRFSEEVLTKCLSDFNLPLSLQLNTLSMGQRKKAFVSLALATQTKYLFMDEPTNGLDIPSKSQFRRVVANNMTDDRTLIISTHQVHDVEQLLDHILILDNSRLLVNASVADITSKYRFDLRAPQDMGNDVIYAEPSLQGNACITLRKEDDQETQLNLELFFNAVISLDSEKIKI
jgi:ABC-2 type transport system ATP-binding protein